MLHDCFHLVNFELNKIYLKMTFLWKNKKLILGQYRNFVMITVPFDGEKSWNSLYTSDGMSWKVY